MVHSGDRGFAWLLGVTLLVTPVFLTGCAGENLFGLAAAVGGVGIEIEITSPEEGAEIAEGLPVQVTGEAAAPAGVGSAKFSGVFKESGAAAFVSETETFQNPAALQLDNTLVAADGAGTGSVYIIIEVTDGLGAVKADTVTITVN